MLTGRGQTQWFLPEPDEAAALDGLIGKPDPHQEVLRAR
jgi:hypothetical protein